MKRRTWHYVMKPFMYDIHCDKCEGRNIEWSEFEHMIWCYNCQIDTKGFDGIFGGPIGWGVSQLLGISFDRWNIKKQRVEYVRICKDRRLRWYAKPPEHKVI